MPDSAPAIILFDGVCNLCDGFVQFVIRHDRRGQFRFAALQSEAGRALLAAHGHAPAPAADPSADPAADLSADPGADPDSVVLVQGGQVYTRSTAVLHLAHTLGWPWRLLGAGWLVPRAWRDAAYRFVARHRYRWFGRKETCMLPTPELRGRFL